MRNGTLPGRSAPTAGNDGGMPGIAYPVIATDEARKAGDTRCSVSIGTTNLTGRFGGVPACLFRLWGRLIAGAC